MRIQCSISDRKGRYRLENAQLIHRIMNRMSVGTTRGFGVIAHECGVYIIQRGSDSGLRVLWLGIPHKQGFLMSRNTNGLAVIAGVDDLSTDLPVQLDGQYLHSSRPACYDEAGEVGFIIPLSKQRIAVAVDLPHRVDMDTLLDIRSRLQKSVPVPAGSYRLDDGIGIFSFSVGDIPAQMLCEMNRSRFDVLFKAPKELRWFSYRSVSAGRVPTDLIGIPFDRYQSVLTDSQLGKLIDLQRLKKGVDPSCRILLSEESQQLLELVADRMQVDTVYLSVTYVYGNSSSDIVAKFGAAAASVRIEQQRKLLLFSDFGQSILDPLWISLFGGSE